MAKSDKKRGFKGEAIRQYLIEHPKTPAKAIITALAEKGVEVSENHVYFVKSNMSRRKHRQQRQKAEEASRATGMPNPAQAVSKVKILARELGGLKHLKQLVDVLSE